MKNIILVVTTCLILNFSARAEEATINVKPLKATVGTVNIGKNQTTSTSIQLSLESPYKAYKDKFRLKVLRPEGVDVRNITVTPMVSFMDPVTKKEKIGLKGEGRLLAELYASANLKEASEIVFEITYQACTDQHCLFPTKYELKAPLVISNASMTEGTSAIKKPTAFGFDSALQRGLLFTFGFVFIAGILTSFTPCIFPMIPITLSIIGASQMRHMPGSTDAIKGHSRWRGFSLSVAYVLGIAITYALLGVIAAKTGALFGSALSNIWVVSAIAFIFVAMGLSMYGLYEIQIPSFVRNKLSNTKTDPGYIGAFIAGLIAGVVASPCVGPVLVGLLAHVSQTQDAVMGFSLLFTFAIGMGLLLIAVGTFSSLSRKLPRSGPWMEFVKFIFGSAMIGMALYYLDPITPQPYFDFLVALTCILISSYFGAFEANEKLHNAFARLRKGSMLALFAIGIAFILRGIAFNSKIKMPMMTSQSESHSLWSDYSDEAFEAALAAGRPIIIDFWADWCAACKELERFTFSDPLVQSELKNFALFRLDMTLETERTAKYRNKFRVLGLPTILFYNGGELRSDLTLTGFESKDDFTKRLQKVLN